MTTPSPISYAILDSEGRCINRTLWDGVSDWQPPTGCSAIPDPDELYPIEQNPEVMASIPPDWPRFGREAMASAELNYRLAVAVQIAPAAAFLLPAAVLQLLNGGSAEPFVEAWRGLAERQSLGPTLADEMAGLAEQCALPDEFIAAIRDPFGPVA